MKFDKETLIAIAVCLVILFGWEPLARKMGWIQSAPAPAATVQTQAPAAAPNAAPALPAEPVSATAPATAAVKPLPPVTLRNDEMALVFNPVEGTIDSIRLEQYLNASRTEPIVLDQSISRSGALSVYDARQPWTVVSVLKNEVQDDKYTLIREVRTPAHERLLVIQSWSIAAEDYTTLCALTFKNLENQSLVLPEVVVNGGDLAPWKYTSGDKIRSDSHRMDFLTTSGDFVDLKSTADDEDFFQIPAPQVRWAGIGNKYFACILASETPFTLHQGRELLPNLKSGEREVLTVGAALSPITLAPGESKTMEFRYYSGPKETELLQAFDGSTARMMHLAWGPLDYLARLLLWVLVWLHGLCGSYGISIIILTLMVRILFYPVTAKANASMKRMQSLQPKIQEIREKYKSEPQKMNAMTMELYRKEKVNPFGGCLPILLQIPVFFALYATLDGAVQLRQVSFLWAHDLAAADTIARIPLYFFNLPINPLVLLMTGLMVVQQHMTPMAMDPMQKKMMMAMPLVMLFVLYDLPSGLTLYWTVSNFFSIIQLWLQKRSGAVSGAAAVKKAN